MPSRTPLSIVVAAVFAMLPLGALADAGANHGVPVPSSATTFVDSGPNASDAQGTAILQQIEKKFGGVMRGMYGWDDGAFERLYTYKNLPVSVLQRALAAPSYQQMLAAFSGYDTLASQSAMTKAFTRKTYEMNETLPGEEANAVVVEAKSLAQKVLGDATKDLVFIPVTPCTVWDTRYATNATAAGTITNGATKSFWAYTGASPSNFASLGGNASCAETNTPTAGGVPVAVMLTVYVNNPTANGWLTLYKYGDPDPSQGTISVYYSPGPTRTQTVISKVAGAAYDVSATSRYASVDASASVIGYFMQSPATALNCTNVEVTGTGTANVGNNTQFAITSAPACTTGYTATGVSCEVSLSVMPAGLALAQSGGMPGSGWWACVWRNQTGGTLDAVDFTATTHCCRVPGR